MYGSNLSKSTWKLLWLEISKMLIAVKKDKFKFSAHSRSPLDDSHSDNVQITARPTCIQPARLVCAAGTPRRCTFCRCFFFIF